MPVAQVRQKGFSMCSSKCLAGVPSQASHTACLQGTQRTQEPVSSKAVQEGQTKQPTSALQELQVLRERKQAQAPKQEAPQQEALQQEALHQLHQAHPLHRTRNCPTCRQCHARAGTCTCRHVCTPGKLVQQRARQRECVRSPCTCTSSHAGPTEQRLQRWACPQQRYGGLGACTGSHARSSGTKCSAQSNQFAESPSTP